MNSSRITVALRHAAGSFFRFPSGLFLLCFCCLGLSAAGTGVESIGIWQGIDYGDPGSGADTRQVFKFIARTSAAAGFTGIQVNPPAGLDFAIVPEPGEPPAGSITRVWASGDSLVWEYQAAGTADDFLAVSFGDGDFTASFAVADGAPVVAIVPFSLPGDGSPIPGPTGEPELVNPAGGGALVEPDVTFSWAAPGAGQATGVRLALHPAADPDGIPLFEHAAGPAENAHGPVLLDAWGEFRWTLAVLRAYAGNSQNGILYEVGKFSAGAHFFRTSGPTLAISGSVAYEGFQSGTILVQAFRTGSGFTGEAAGEVELTEPGPYSVPALPAGFTYVLRGFRDTDGNGLPGATEAQGVFGNNGTPQELLLDENREGIDISLGDPDSNGDGLPDYWKILHGLEPLLDDSNGDGVPDTEENPDNDRLDNLREYQLGTDPAHLDQVVVWFDAVRDAGRNSLKSSIAGAAAAATAAGYTLTARRLPFSTAEFAGVDAVFLYDPQAVFAPAEVAALQEFLGQGGRLLAFGGGLGAPDGGASYRTLLAAFGIVPAFTTVAGNLDTIVQTHPVSQGLTPPLRTGGEFVPLAGGSALATDGSNVGAVAFALPGGGRGVAAGAAAMLAAGFFTANEEEFLLQALDWLVTPWRLEINLENAQTGSLSLAQRVGAAEGLDGYDALAAPAGPLEAAVLLRTAGSELRTDYRPPAAASAWRLDVDNRAAATDCTLSWDASQVPAPGIYLYEVDADGNGVPGGTGFAMNGTPDLTVPAGALRRYLIVYGAGTIELSLSPGWNLVSLPFNPLDAAPGVVLRALHSGQVWDWRRGYYAPAALLVAGRGYWVYSPAVAPVSCAVAGLPVASAWASLNAGWNLVGPVGEPLGGVLVTPLVVVPDTAAASPLWAWLAGNYVRPEWLLAGEAGWIYLRTAATVFLGLEEPVEE